MGPRVDAVPLSALIVIFVSVDDVEELVRLRTNVGGRIGAACVERLPVLKQQAGRVSTSTMIRISSCLGEQVNILTRSVGRSYLQEEISGASDVRCRARASQR